MDLDFQLFFEESPDEVLVLLPDSPKFTAVAATKARLLATHSTWERTVGRGFFELFPDNLDDPSANYTRNLRASLERVLATRAADTMALQMYDIPLPGGFEAKYCSPRNIPILAADGSVQYILHRADVTDLAEAGRRAAKWTAELELANRELDAFSYSVAHDLRGPLRTIDGFSRMLQTENAPDLNEEGLRRLDMIRMAVERMSQLIDDLLHLARMGRSDIRRIPFDLSSVVRTVAMQLQEGKPDRNVELAIADAAEVHADPHLLQIALENLLNNAWKFTAKRVDARIEFGCREISGERCFFIRDNGAGFDMKYSSKLFGVFQRLHAESEFHGTGVGLATVKRIVTRHGGRVWAEGEVGNGASFYFTLGPAPACAEAAQAGGEGRRGS